MSKPTQAVIDAAIKNYATNRAASLMPHLQSFAVAAGDSGIVPPGTWAKDAQQGLSFMISQLAYTEATVFARQYEPRQYQMLVPVSTEAGEWAENIRYETSDNAGRGRRVSGSGDDIPYVDVNKGEKVFGVAPAGIGYSYTQQEIIQSAYFKRPLSSARMVAAVEGFQYHMNDVALFGEADFMGLFNHTSIAKGNRPSGVAWATATPDQILADLNAGMLYVLNASSKNDVVDTIVLPLAMYSQIATTARSANSDMTILQYFLENNIRKAMRGDNVTVVPGYGLETAGTGSTTRAVFYVKNADRVVFHISQPLRFLAPQAVNLAIKVPGTYRYAGVEWRYQKSAYYMEAM